jgi:glucose dehydrogenase
MNMDMRFIYLVFILVDVGLYLLFRSKRTQNYIVYSMFFFVGLAFGYMLYQQDPGSLGSLGWIVILFGVWLHLQYAYVMRKYADM